MQNLDTLKQKVDKLYTSGDPKADPWIDWSYPNHVLVVAELSERIAKTHGAKAELAVAGALLHDVADAVMSRFNPRHEAESLAIAGRLLQESGFSAADAAFVVNEIIKPHSCKELKPTALEGKVMATADGAAHFLSDFYPLFCWRHYGPKDDYAAFKDWMRGKMEKDFTAKLFFEDIKEEVRPRYEALRLVFLGEEVK
jgi:hypothetical protein